MNIGTQLGLRLAVLTMICPLMAAGAEPNLRYPDTRRSDQVDVYHGVQVPDPYRWLEDTDSEETKAWVEAQNKVTFSYLEKVPQRASLRERLTKLWNFERYGTPEKRGGRYFYTRNDGLQNQSVLYVAESLDAPPRELLDPNQLSQDGTVALVGWEVSEDGRYLAYGLAAAGSDWNEWKVKEVATGQDRSDHLRWVKFSGVSWTPDNRGFFYSRYDEPKKGAEFQVLNLNNRLCYHRVGTAQADDVPVYHRPEHPEWMYYPSVSDDGRYLVITTSRGTDEKYRITVKDLAEPYAMPIELIDHFDHEFGFVGSDGAVLLFKTDLEAPRRRVIAIDLARPGRADWREIIPQAQAALQETSMVGNLLVASYLKDVLPQVKVFSLRGELVREVEFPGIGSAAGFRGRRTHTETFYSFSSFATPPSIYRYDLITGKSRLLRRAEVKFKPEDYEVKQVFYASKDGTRVPMFVAHKKGLRLDGSNPTLLYGYGGFNISMTPGFSVGRLGWMEMGGVFALANLRGGGEYGQAWHDAGRLLKKQNVFDDFIAAAEWLIANRYTRPDKLAIQGGSNGGLLVGAVMTQRPELFGACLPAVGVMDMLRFDKFTEGRLWVDDYGSSSNPEQFKALRAYSPYHNLKPGAKYPATLVSTADTDDRVIPGHSFKFAAALQAAQAGDAPVLIRITSRAGHGAGKPTTKRIEETADDWTFLVKTLRIKLP